MDTARIRVCLRGIYIYSYIIRCVIIYGRVYNLTESVGFDEQNVQKID